MKPAALISVVLLLMATLGLVITNPGPAAFEQYASAQAEQYFSEEVCAELPAGINELLVGRCLEMVETLKPQLQAIIRDRTQHLNLGVASIYRTSFGIPELAVLPSYEIETLGIMGRFITYRATQKAAVL